MDSLRVFVGYDAREHDAVEVCVRSLHATTTIPLEITALHQGTLREVGLYRRTVIRQDGQRLDSVDMKPFSTDFAFTRFLVPALCLYQGYALFVDCDFLFRASVDELLPYMDPHKAVHVVKHAHLPKSEIKMDRVSQTRYPRKNWSSFVLWNCGHPAHRALTPDAVNYQRGQWLHGFSWLDNDAIGELPEAWNWLEGHSDPEIDPKAVHFTEGGPWFPNYQEVAYAEEWRAYRE